MPYNGCLWEVVETVSKMWNLVYFVNSPLTPMLGAAGAKESFSFAPGAFAHDSGTWSKGIKIVCS